MKNFEVAIETHRHLLKLTLRGFWDIATFEAFATEFEAALRKLHAHGGCTYALVDGREFAVQQLEISQRFGQLIAAMAPLAARRTASVVAAQLNRMQAERASESINTRSFTDFEEAQAWLFSDGADARPRAAQG